MDALAQQLLSGTGLPHHHDIGVRLGKGLGLLDTGYHPRAAGDDIPEGVLGLVSLVVELFAQLVLRDLDLRSVQQGNHSSSPEAVHHHVFRFDGQVGVFVSDKLVRVLRRGHDAAQRRGGEHGGCRLSQILFPAGELQNLDGSWNRAVFLPQLQQDIDNVRSVDNQFDHPDREGAAAQVQIDGTPSDHGVAVRPLRQQPGYPGR